MSKGCFGLFTVYQLWKRVRLRRSGEDAAGEELGRIPNAGEHLDVADHTGQHLDDVIHTGSGGETNAAFDDDSHGRDGPTPPSDLGTRQNVNTQSVATTNRIQDDM